MEPIKELLFDEETHTYTYGGIIVPSVTTVLKPLSDEVYGSIDRAILDAAAERGTAVHTAIETFVKYGIEDTTERIFGYFTAFMKWLVERNVTVLKSELRLVNPILMYAGTTDMIAEVQGVKTLLDFKTSAVVHEVLCRPQLEAYSRAYQAMTGEGIKQKMIVQLSYNGEWREYIYKTDPADWRVFNALLTVRSYRQKFLR